MPDDFTHVWYIKKQKKGTDMANENQSLDP